MPLSSHLSTPPLVRLFQDWAVASGEPVPLGQSGRQDVAERLGEWLSAMGSVKLDGALQTIAAYGAQQAARPARVGQSVDGLALDAACRQVRADLAALIAQRLAQAPAESADYPPQLQLYQALQKQMETRVSALRGQVRQTLGKGPARLRQLASLDAVMAEMLGEREQKLLAAVPIYLERRFAHWRERHARLAAQTLVSAEASIDVDINVDAGTQVGVDASPPAPDPQEEAQRWLAPGGWLHGFQQDMRQMLLAELQTRLAPVQGLIEAAGAQPH